LYGFISYVIYLTFDYAIKHNQLKVNRLKSFCGRFKSRLTLSIYLFLKEINMKENILALVLLSIIATPAMADNTGKVYVAGSLGSASFTNANITINGAANTFPNPGTAGIAVGYQISPNLAAEVGYASFGDSTLTSRTGDVVLSSKSVTIAALGLYPLGSGFDLMGKLGVSMNSAAAKTTGTLVFTDGTTSSTASRSDVLFGLGAQYHVNSQLSVRALYENFGKFDSSSAPLAVTALSLGVAYSF
jgi:OOP family OmpA-OmpF porin